MSAAEMDRIYRFQRHIYDVTRRYYLLGRNACIAELSPGRGQSVLEIGCGTGRNCVAVARRYPMARIRAFDISQVMLETARAATARAGLTERIALTQADATHFVAGELFPDLASGADRIMLSYVLSMIPDWRAALRAAIANLAPGGEIHIVDFGPCDGLPKVFRTALDAWLARFHVTRRTDLADEARLLAARHSLALNMSSAFRGYALTLVIGNARAEIQGP